MALRAGVAALLSLILTVVVHSATIAQNVSSPLVNFQVSEPLTLPGDAHKCEVPLIHRVFGNSYYNPEVVTYTPPTGCGPVGTWAGISLNWTATSKGRQYDRLAGVTLGNVEIWRTSTSEPTQNGIIWTALKDVTKYLPLFSGPGTLIVDLNNILDPSSGLDGEYDVHLSATFYQSDSSHPKASTADLVAPLSTLQSGQSNMFTVPPTGNTTVSLPRHAITAIAEIQASGNFQEEFWYYNIPDEYLSYLPPDTTYGKSSFREVRLLVDGYVAGIVFPYPVLFTGAYIPTVWRPIVSYGTYDLPTYNVDLTPFIPILADGQEHIVSLDVVSDELDHTLNPNWYLSGNIQVGLNPSGEPTTGRITRYEVPPYATTHHAMKSLGDDSYNFSVSATHNLLITADITPGGGPTNRVVWNQALQFTNIQSYLHNASQMLVAQNSGGTSASYYNGVRAVMDSFSFPLSIDLSSVEDDVGSGYSTSFDHKYDRAYCPSVWETTTYIESIQRANGTYITQPNTGQNRTANGTNINNFRFSDNKMRSYFREVEATNNIITRDKEGGTLAWDFWPLSNGGIFPNSSDTSASFAPARIPARLH